MPPFGQLIQEKRYNSGEWNRFRANGSAPEAGRVFASNQACVEGSRALNLELKGTRRGGIEYMLHNGYAPRFIACGSAARVVASN
jgi:hypothetical protein